MQFSKNIKTWNLKKKITFFVSLAFLTTSITILILSTISSVYYMSNQSSKMAREQLETLAKNYDSTLTQYQNLVVALVIDDSVQDYCKDDKGINNIENSKRVYDYLLNMLNVQNNINFAVVKKNNEENGVYKGNVSVFASNFNEAYEEDYAESIQMKDGSSMRMSFNNAYFRDGRYTLTIYHPIYLTSKITVPKGMLIMNIDDSFLNQISEDANFGMNSKTFLIDKNGTCISVSESNMMGKTVDYHNKIVGTSGSFVQDGYQVNYQKVNNWNYYLVNEIPLVELYKGSLTIMLILLVVIVFISSISIFILHKMIDSFYEPLNRVILVMGDVKDGKMYKRIEMQSMDSDSLKLAEVFNSMMDEIDMLMERIKTEQVQLEQIKFNALYAQIKPHFLYNTLECIHWQSVAGGNKEVSTMVKAMAQYYRLCLSQGKEVINIETEIEHIYSYLIIQNMRYDNIIELDVKVDEEFLGIKIPKMTLQPLIENAIYHGVKSKNSGKGKVIINLKKQNDDVILEISDDGIGMSEEKINEINKSISEHDENFGYGVRNVNRRIEIIFGEDYGLYFRINENGGVTVDIKLPIAMDSSYKEIL